MRGLIEAVAMLALALIGAVALRVHLWEDGTLPLADASAGVLYCEAPTWRHALI